MSYKELIARALHGRSINQAARDMAVQQVTLNRYVRGERLPDYTTAFLLAKEAGIDPREMFMALVEEEARKKGLMDKISGSFKRLIELMAPRRSLRPA